MASHKNVPMCTCQTMPDPKRLALTAFWNLGMAPWWSVSPHHFLQNMGNVSHDHRYFYAYTVYCIYIYIYMYLPHVYISRKKYICDHSTSLQNKLSMVPASASQMAGMFASTPEKRHRTQDIFDDLKHWLQKRVLCRKEGPHRFDPFYLECETIMIDGSNFQKLWVRAGLRAISVSIFLDFGHLGFLQAQLTQHAIYGTQELLSTLSSGSTIANFKTERLQFKQTFQVNIWLPNLGAPRFWVHPLRRLSLQQSLEGDANSSPWDLVDGWRSDGGWSTLATSWPIRHTGKTFWWYPDNRCFDGLKSMGSINPC